MTTRPELDAIIVSYRDPGAVLSCLRSLDESTRRPDRVWVVDNASGDGTVDAVRREHPACRVLANERNPGFAGGANAGLEAALAAGAQYLLVLNQDTTLAPDLIAVLLEFMEANPRAGAVGARTLSTRTTPDGRPLLLYAGSWRGRLPLSQRIPGIERPDTGRHARPVPVDFVWGHGMLLRASALAGVGLFDPDFFMYYEDLDLCCRLKAAGHEVWCQPAAVMWHRSPDGARAVTSEYWRWVQKAKSTRVFLAKRHGPARTRLLAALAQLAEAWRLARRRRLRALAHLLRAEFSRLLGRAE